jgi:hypothetical protein
LGSKTLTPSFSKLVPDIKVLDLSIPCHPAKPMIISPKLESGDKADVYVDDICLVGLLSDKDSDLCLQNSILLALDIVTMM